MKRLSNSLCLRKCRSSSDQEFSTTKRTSRKNSMTTAKENQTPIHSHSQYYKKKSESCFNLKQTLSETSSSSASNKLEFSLIPTPKTPKNSKEILHKSLMKLRSCQWNEPIIALQNIVQISRFNPQMLEKCSSEIWKGTTAILKSLRSRAARTACQAANELFMNIKSFKGPDFEELIHTLLQKSAVTKKSLKKDVLEALDSMVIHVPPDQTVKILLHRKIAGYNISARKTATKLLACVLSTTGAELARILNEDSKTRVVQASVRFMEDDCNDIKFHGMHIVTILMQQKEFQDIFHAKITLSILNKRLESVRNFFGKYKR